MSKERFHHGTTVYWKRSCDGEPISMHFKIRAVIEEKEKRFQGNRGENDEDKGAKKKSLHDAISRNDIIV